MAPYTYDNAWTEERRRLGGLEAMYDPGTRAAISSTGIAPGWRCLEIGGGGGSVAQWLVEQTKPGGRVVATDLDIRFLEAIDGVEARRHDIVADDLERDAFDLVHSRCLLEHLPQRDVVLKRMFEAVRPGGWIVIEDFDFTQIVSEAPLPVYPRESEPLMRKTNHAIRSLMEMAGYDPAFGRLLPVELIGLGAVDTQASVRSTLVHHGDPGSDFYRYTLEQLSGALSGAGLLTEDEVERALAIMSDPAIAMMSVPLVSAWGRKPA